jgi:hypothetical protein
MPINRPPVFDPLRFVVTPAVTPAPTAPPDPEKSREALIAEAAYSRAQRRGFEPGHEEEDWLAAEAEIDKLLSERTR